jgi:hypothetical protein
MSAFFTDAQIAAVSETVVRVALPVQFDFASGTKYAWNGTTPLVVDGNTYLPMYGFGQIDGLGIGGGEQSEAVTLSLDGLPDQNLDILSSALAETGEVDQQLLTVSLQLFDDDWQTVGVPIGLFRGFMQPPRVTRTPGTETDGGTQSVSLTAENIFYGRARPPYGRNTDRDQQARSPGDKFFGFVSTLLFKKITYPDY